MVALPNSQSRRYELRFEPLSCQGHAYAFACDCNGHVDLDRMSDRTRNNYLFARSLIGRDVSRPRVLPAP